MGNFLKECMIEREKMLFENKVVLSCVYLDPRFNFLLNAQQKTIAVLHIYELYTKMETMEPQQATEINETITTDDFASYLKNVAKTSTNINSERVPSTEQAQILYKIQHFENRPVINYKSNIIEYWSNLKSEEPQLYDVAMVLLCVPVSQVSVERAFSSLSYIFNNYRSRLKYCEKFWWLD